MGTWGAGNLESDYALDELGERCDALVTEMMKRARRSTSRESDEYDYTTLFVELEIVLALDAKGLLLSDELPAPDEVDALKKEFVAEWAPCHRKMAHNEASHLARRKVILSTFARFKRLCARHQAKSDG